MLELGMNLRYLLDHQILPLRGRHSAESAGVLPPGVAGEEDAWLVRNRRIARLALADWTIGGVLQYSKPIPNSQLVNTSVLANVLNGQ